MIEAQVDGAPIISAVVVGLDPNVKISWNKLADPVCTELDLRGKIPCRIIRDTESWTDINSSDPTWVGIKQCQIIRVITRLGFC